MASVEKRNNSYRITVSAGYDKNGKQIKKSTTWKPSADMTEKQIEKELERQKVLFEEQCLTGKVGTGAVKLQEFIERYFTDYADTHLRKQTINRYRQLTQRVYHKLGHLRIDRIQPHDLIKFYNYLGQEDAEIDCPRTAKMDIKQLLKQKDITYNKLSEMSGLGLRTIKSAANNESVSDKSAIAISKALQIPKADLFKATEKEQRKLSAKTIKHYHTFLSSVMERAVKWGVITDNPCHRVDAPKVTPKEIKCLESDEAILFLEALENEPIEYKVIFHILILTGIRRGELLGLEWSDIDFDNNTISIRRTSQYLAKEGIYTDTTKTEKSKRIISIPKELTKLLKQYKMVQTETELALGDKWVKSNRICIKWNGEPMHPNTPYSKFESILKKNNLPHVSMHSLRHTNATIMINSGTDIKTVSSRLGHSQTSTTLNIYAHQLQTANEAASENISNALLKRE